MFVNKESKCVSSPQPPPKGETDPFIYLSHCSVFRFLQALSPPLEGAGGRKRMEPNSKFLFPNSSIIKKIKN